MTSPESWRVLWDLAVKCARFGRRRPFTDAWPSDLEAAFRSLYEHLRCVFFGIARRSFSFSPEDIEDLYQEFWRKLLRGGLAAAVDKVEATSLHEGISDDALQHFQAYLCKAARSVLLDEIDKRRAHKRQTPVGDTNAEIEKHREPGANAELRETILEALEKTLRCSRNPDRDAALIFLKRYQELGFWECSFFLHALDWLAARNKLDNQTMAREVRNLFEGRPGPFGNALNSKTMGILCGMTKINVNTQYKYLMNRLRRILQEQALNQMPNNSSDYE